MQRAILVLLAIFGTSTVLADEATKRGERMDRPAMRGGPIEISAVIERTKQQFTRTDQDGDGELTAAELTKMSVGSRRVASIGEGETSADQEARRARAQKRLEIRAQEMLEKFDTDGTGGLSVEEYTKSRVEALQKLDADKDGKVSREEMREGRANRERF